MRSNATLRINDPSDPDTLLVLGVAATIERTDTDEIAIHATLSRDHCAVSSIYLTVAEAALLAARLLAETASPEGGEDRG